MPVASAEHRSRWWLLGIVAVGSCLRVAWALYATRPAVGLHDPTFYSIFAGQIADGRGYRLLDGQPTAYYPVGYPAALAAVYWLADLLDVVHDRLSLVVALNLAAAGASFALVFEVGRRLFDHRVGLVAAAGLALMPNLVFHTGLALTETLFNAVALAAVLVVVATSWRERHVGALVAFGALVGVSALIRPPSLLFVPVLALAGARSAGWGWREGLRSLVVPALAAAAVIAPWTVRNIVVMEAPVLISTNMGDNLCIGNNPAASGHFQPEPSCLDGYGALRRPELEVRRDADNRRRGIEYIRNEPLAQIRLVGLRLLNTFRNDTDGLRAAESYGDDPFIPGPTRTALGVAANVTFFATLVLGLASLVVCRGRDQRRPGRVFVALAGASLAVTPLAFFGDPRFHVPVVPFLVVGAAAVLVAGPDRLRAR